VLYVIGEDFSSVAIFQLFNIQQPRSHKGYCWEHGGELLKEARD
jgi:hypothetical protein